jgi:tetratricopeptide (TPR) repeat protein
MRIQLLAVLICAGSLLAQRAPIEQAWDLVSKGESKQAVGLLRRIIAADPRDGEARLLLGSILMEQGERSESIAQLEEAVRLKPKSAEAHNALGEAYNAFSQFTEARAEFEKTLALDQSFAPAHVSLGLILLQSDDFDSAAPHLDRAIALLGRKPDAAYPRYLRAKIYTEKNDAQKAAALLKEALALRPDFAEAWSDLGQVRKTLLDDAGALVAFQRAVAAGPDDAVAQYRLGSEYLHQGDTRQAITHLKESFRLNPQDQSTLYNLQMALRKDGQTEQANEVKKKLAELLRKRDTERQAALTAVQINNQGAELEKAGNLSEALEKYRAALKLDPNHVGVRVNLAIALLRLGHWDEGIKELRDAQRQDPNNADLQRALNDALAQAPKKASQ